MINLKDYIIATIKPFMLAYGNSQTNPVYTTCLTSGSVYTLGIYQSNVVIVSIRYDNPENVTINLPATPDTNTVYFIKDTKNIAQYFNITICGNGNKIDEQDSVLLRHNGDSAICVFDGTSWSTV
jgi:hypothetical protein